ncbi:diadenylate cyclase, partial [Planctomycetota bacterium]|nr:diadenylate cyclase [Planctomycetota bacterium]
RALNLTSSEQVDLSAAVQAREAALNTQLAPGWAAPHAFLDSATELVCTFGRTKGGIDWGRPELGRVHFVTFFISSQENHDLYLKVLARLTGVIRDTEGSALEKAIVADTPQKLKRALGEKTRKARLVVSRRLPQVTRALIRNLLKFAEDTDAEAIILFSDVFRKPELLMSFVNKRIILATRAMDIPQELADKAGGVVRLARGDFSVESAVQLAILSAGAKGFLGNGSRVVAVCGEKGSDTFDTIRIEAPRLLVSRIFRKGKSGVKADAFERAMQLLVELSEEGREGKAIGAAIVMGDAEVVREYSQQLTINPFRGYSDNECNILDPSLEETIKEFAHLDGAFIVSREGIIQSAGTYLSPPAEVRVDLVSGLGTRHRVAAAMTKATKAVALVLSQSTGKITVYRGGKEVLAVTPSRHRHDTTQESDS